VPKYEDAEGTEESIRFYLEQGAALDLMIRPLFWIERDAVRSYLEVGCGFGLSLDFARHTFGWAVRGIDPSWSAAAGARLLGLDIVNGYLDGATPSVAGPYDLVLASEVLEHVKGPNDFLTHVGQQLTGQGVLILTTPNAAGVRPDAPFGALLPLLSPGFHTVLFTEESLRGLLRAHGFTTIHIEVTWNNLTVIAARRPCWIDPHVPVDRRLYRGYLDERRRDFGTDISLWRGLAYRYFKELVCAGLYDEAMSVFAELTAAFRVTYGLDLNDPAAIRLDHKNDSTFNHYIRANPSNLCGIAYFRGMIDLNKFCAFPSALDYFRLAERVGTTLRLTLQSIGADDGETENLTWLARLHALRARLHIDPVAVASEIQSFCEGRGPRIGFPLPMEMLVEARRDIFLDLVNTGAYEAADLLFDPIARELEELIGKRCDSSKTPAQALAIFYDLGILALNHRSDFATAAQWFGVAYGMGRRLFDSGDGTDQSNDLLWRARYHEMLAWSQMEDWSKVSTLADEVLDPDYENLPPSARDALDSIAELKRRASAVAPAADCGRQTNPCSRSDS
jgi:SAM-dependent methyltransferase